MSLGIVPHHDRHGQTRSAHSESMVPTALTLLVVRNSPPPVTGTTSSNVDARREYSNPLLLCPLGSASLLLLTLFVWPWTKTHVCRASSESFEVSAQHFMNFRAVTKPSARATFYFTLFRPPSRLPAASVESLLVLLLRWLS